jgi:hypothetical protein
VLASHNPRFHYPGFHRPNRPNRKILDEMGGKGGLFRWMSTMVFDGAGETIVLIVHTVI